MTWVRPKAERDDRIEITSAPGLSGGGKLVGQTLAERYHVRAAIGMGATAQVYRAFDERTDGEVAIKLFDPEAHEALEEFFGQELRFAAEIVSPHLVHAIDRGRHGEQPFIVFELVKGHSLGGVRLMPWREVCEVALHVLDALAALHRRGVVHRDVKPGNIFLSRKLGGAVHAVLLDLGFAVRWATQAAGDEPLEVFGTEGFIAPEVLAGRPVEPRSDLYALGVVMYLLLTSCEPPDPLRSHPDLQVPSTRAFLPSIPPAVDEVVMRALSDIDERWTSAEKMTAAISAAMRVAPSCSSVAPGSSAGERRVGPRLGWFAGGVSAAALVSGAVYLSQGPEDARGAWMSERSVEPEGPGAPVAVEDEPHAGTVARPGEPQVILTASPPKHEAGVEATRVAVVRPVRPSRVPAATATFAAVMAGLEGRARQCVSKDSPVLPLEVKVIADAGGRVEVVRVANLAEDHPTALCLARLVVSAAPPLGGASFRRYTFFKP